MLSLSVWVVWWVRLPTVDILVNWNKCAPDKTQAKCCKAYYTLCLWSWLPVSTSSACGWTDWQKKCTHKKDWRYCVHTVCVYIARRLAGFVYCAFLLSSLMKIQWQIATTRTNQSSLAHLVEVLFRRWKNTDMQSEPMPSYPRKN